MHNETIKIHTDILSSGALYITCSFLKVPCCMLDLYHLRMLDASWRAKFYYFVYQKWYYYEAVSNYILKQSDCLPFLIYLEQALF